jgi:hypothetical protein
MAPEANNADRHISGTSTLVFPSSKPYVFLIAAGNGALTISPDYNLEEFPQFWNLKCDDWEDPAVWVEFLRRRKYVKRRLMIGADHFNRDPKKVSCT